MEVILLGTGCPFTPMGKEVIHQEVEKAVGVLMDANNDRVPIEGEDAV